MIKRVTRQSGYRPRIGSYMKISNQAMDDIPAVSSMARRVLTDSFKKEKGKFFYGFRLEIGMIKDDFLYDHSTAVLKAYWYKKPRIIKAQK